MRLTFIALALALVVGASCRSEPAPPLKPPITVTRVDPAWGIPEGGTIVYVRGTNFDPKSRVRVTFGAREAPMAAVLTKDNIQVTIPKGAEGESTAVTVTFADGRSATVPSAFVWKQPPAEH